MAELGYRHYAGLTGSNIKTVGADQDIYQYTNLETCIAASQANDVIVVDQGTYSLTATNTIDYNLQIVGRGRVIINGGTAGIAAGLISLDKPAGGTAATYMHFQNIIFANAHATADVFMIDNDAGGTGALDITFLGCSIDAGVGAQAIDLDQTTTDEHVYLRLVGTQGNILNDCTFGLSYAGSYVHIEGYDMTAEATYFILDAINVASEYQWKNCIFASAAVTTTGAATIKQNFINCCNETANEVRALAYSDIDATGNVNIIGGGIGYETPVTQIVGAAGLNYSVTSLATAVAAAASGDTIFLEPGTHTIVTDTTLTINKSLTIVGRGRALVYGDVADRMIMINKPATGTAATNIEFHNVHFQNISAGDDVIEVDNDGTGTGDLNIISRDCSYASNGGMAWDVDQTTNTISLSLSIIGHNGLTFDSCNFALSKASSVVNLEGYDLSTGHQITLGADDVASFYNFKNLIFGAANSVVGGAASVLINFMNCLNAYNGTYQEFTTFDCDATGVESICGGAVVSPLCHLVGPTDNRGYPYATLLAAVTAASAGDVIYLEPGTHTIATDTTLSLIKNITIIGKGRCILTGNVTGTLIDINKPADGATATYIEFRNIEFANTSDAADILSIDNDTGGTGALYVNVLDCSFAVTGAGLSIDLDQTTATEHIYLYVKSQCRKDKPMVTMNLNFALAGSEAYFEGIDFGASVHVLGTNNIANILTFAHCMYQSEAFMTGGSASLIVNLWDCIRNNSGTHEIPAAGDFDQTSASEQILPAS